MNSLQKAYLRKILSRIETERNTLQGRAANGLLTPEQSIASAELNKSLIELNELGFDVELYGFDLEGEDRITEVSVRLVKGRRNVVVIDTLRMYDEEMEEFAFTLQGYTARIREDVYDSLLIVLEEGIRDRTVTIKISDIEELLEYSL